MDLLFELICVKILCIDYICFRSLNKYCLLVLGFDVEICC